MIIFGTRIYGKKNIVQGWGRCEECNIYGPNTSYSGRKWGHVYYIPLIPDGPPVRVVNECASCNRGMHIPQSNVEEMVLSIEQSTEQALTALAAGETQFRIDESEESESCLGALFGPVGYLVSLEAPEVVDGVLARLNELGRTYEHQLVAARFEEVQGRVQEAARRYEEAAQKATTEVLPLLLAGELRLVSGELDQSLAAYRRVTSLDAHNLDAIQGMIDVYTAQNDHWNVAEQYERAFSIVPDLRTQKKIVKAYKKACRKANRPTQLG